MKIRNGFVSNSSSSSFILVGLSAYKNEKAAAIIKATGIDEKADDIDYELTKHGFDGGYGGYKNANGITLFMSDSDICCVGMDIFADLNADLTVTEMKQRFINKVKHFYGIDLQESEVTLICEEFGGG